MTGPGLRAMSFISREGRWRRGRLRFSTTGLITVLLLAGCGSEQHTTVRALDSTEKLEVSCGDLKARLTAIAADTAHAQDVETSMLVRPQIRTGLESATKEAVATLYATAEELEKIHAPYRVLLAVSHGIEGYDRFSQGLARDVPLTGNAGVRLLAHYAGIEFRIDVECSHATADH